MTECPICHAEFELPPDAQSELAHHGDGTAVLIVLSGRRCVHRCDGDAGSPWPLLHRSA